MGHTASILTVVLGLGPLTSPREDNHAGLTENAPLRPPPVLICNQWHALCVVTK